MEEKILIYQEFTLVDIPEIHLLKAGAGFRIQDSEVRGQEEEENWYGESEVFEPRKRRIHFEAEIGLCSSYARDRRQFCNS